MAINLMSKQVLGLIVWMGVTFVAASLGAFASAKAGVFYQTLARPWWAPPAILFAPVWSVLYLLMAISAWLVWRERGFHAACIALLLFLFQLAANALWTWLFFQWHQGFFAFAEILVLWVIILVTLIAFWRVRPVAGALLIPYLLWVTFATALTFYIWKINPHILGYPLVQPDPTASVESLLQLSRFLGSMQSKTGCWAG
ncbi:MAG: TspO/MBR family protein [Candidatus Bathyarchaeia archaeon]